MKCSICGRERPTYITDPSCPQGGYCKWVEKKTEAIEDDLGDILGYEETPMRTPTPRLAIITTEMRNVAEALCAFSYSGNGTWAAQPQRLFRPKGLMIWDAPKNSTLQIFSGVTSQLAVTADPIPTRWFSSWQSFQEVAKAISEGKEPPGWGDFKTLQIGEYVRIRLYTNGYNYDVAAPQDIQMLMWGLTVD